MEARDPAKVVGPPFGRCPFDSWQGHGIDDAEITWRGGGLQSRNPWVRFPPAS
jgi:hypothetical protein